MKIAIIHDWLLSMRGGERCLEAMLELYPDAELYTLFYEPEILSEAIRKRPTYVSLLQRLPGVKNYYRYLLPLYPVATASLSRSLAKRHRESPYDMVISISHCAAKNVAVPSGVPHLCYCLTPARYLWDQFDSYFKGRLVEPVARLARSPLSRWDQNASRAVTAYVAISNFVASRIRRTYNRESAVIYPPVDASWIRPRGQSEAGTGFLSVSALVPYKRVDLMVEAFNELGLPLTIVGKGPEENRLRAMAGSNIEFLGTVGQEQLGELYRRSKALIFAAEEDFGIAPVEMLAAGRPVVAFGRGGVLETVAPDGELPLGVLFPEQTARALVEAVRYLLAHEVQFSVDYCRERAMKFSKARFLDQFKTFADSLSYQSRDRSNFTTAEN